METPRGIGVVSGYEVLRDACTVELEGSGTDEVAIDDCRELEQAL